VPGPAGQLGEAASSSAPARRRRGCAVPGPAVAVIGGLLVGWPVPGLGGQLVGGVTRLGQRAARRGDSAAWLAG
jgi:hypothetical protein